MGANDGSGTLVTIDEGAYNCLKEVLMRYRYPKVMRVEDLLSSLGDSWGGDKVYAWFRGFKFTQTIGHERGMGLEYKIKAHPDNQLELKQLFAKLGADTQIHTGATYRLSVIIDVNDEAGFSVEDPTHPRVFVPHSTLMRTRYDLVETVRRTIKGDS